MSFLALSTLTAVSMPWTGTNDSAFHLDYVYQISHGKLPGPYGLDFAPNGPSGTTARQYASAHPPLFYALAALVAGNSLTATDWQDAVLRIRLLNGVFGAVTVAIIACAARTSTRSNRRSFTVAVAALAPLMTSFVFFSGDIYNDVLLALLSTCALWLGLQCLRSGASWGRVLALAIACAAGMLTKATFLIPWVIAAGAVLIAGLADVREAGGSRLHAVASSLLRTAGVGLLPVLSSGWFYAINFERSGNWMRSTPKAPLLGRPEKSVGDVLSDAAFWKVFPARLLGNQNLGLLGTTTYRISLGVVVLSVMTIVAWSLTRARGWSQQRSLRWVFIRLAPIGLVIGLYVAQLSHSDGFGAFNVRYFLPAVLAVGLLVGGATSVLGRLSGLATSVVMVLFGLALVNHVGWLVTQRRASLDLVDRAHGVVAQAGANGIPHLVLLLLAIVFVVGVVLVGVSMTRCVTDDSQIPAELA
jgi:hypothetical protein